MSVQDLRIGFDADAGRLRAGPAVALAAPHLIPHVVLFVSKRTCHELIEDVSARRRDLAFDDLRRVLGEAGFEMRRPTAGSHRTFVRPDCPFIVTLAERRGPLSVPYVLMVIRALEECCDDE